jgi:hypothetical protein
LLSIAYEVQRSLIELQFKKQNEVDRGFPRAGGGTWGCEWFFSISGQALPLLACCFFASGVQYRLLLLGKLQSNGDKKCALKLDTMTEQYIQQGHMKLCHMITPNLKRLKARNYISW